MWVLVCVCKSNKKQDSHQGSVLKSYSYLEHSSKFQNRLVSLQSFFYYSGGFQKKVDLWGVFLVLGYYAVVVV